MSQLWKVWTYRGSPLFCTYFLLINDGDQSLLCKKLANAGKPGVAFVGFNSPASSAKHVGMQFITFMQAVSQNEQRRSSAAYKCGVDDRPLKSLGGVLNVVRYISIGVKGVQREVLG